MNSSFRRETPSSTWKSAPVAAAAIVIAFSIAAAIGNAVARNVPAEPAPAPVTGAVIITSPADTQAHGVFVDVETRPVFSS